FINFASRDPVENILYPCDPLHEILWHARFFWKIPTEPARSVRLCGGGGSNGYKSLRHRPARRSLAAKSRVLKRRSSKKQSMRFCRYSSSGTYASFTDLSEMIPLFPLGSSRTNVMGNVPAFTRAISARSVAAFSLSTSVPHVS